MFDTSALRSALGAAKGSGALDALELPVREGHLEIHVHQVVLAEVVSGLVDAVSDGLKPARRLGHALSWAMDRSARRLGRDVLNRTERGEIDVLRGNVSDGVAAWVDRLGIKVHPIGIDDAAAVFEHYFAGTAAFRRKRSREDLPDAFILEWLRRFTAEREVVFVCGDRQLRKAAANKPRISVVASVPALLNTVEVKEVLEGVFGGADGVQWRTTALEICDGEHDRLQRLTQQQLEDVLPGSSGLMMGEITLLELLECTAAVEFDLNTALRSGSNEILVSGVASGRAEILAQTTKTIPASAHGDETLGVEVVESQMAVYLECSFESVIRLADDFGTPTRVLSISIDSLDVQEMEPL